MRRMKLRVLVLFVPLAGAACDKKDPVLATSEHRPVPEAPAPKPVELAAVPPLGATPLGLPELVAPPENPLTPEKVYLGAQLFFDKRLSKDGSASCETCHVHELGWADGKALSTKVGGTLNTRHTPTLYNVGYFPVFYWDGRAPTLEKQIEAAWKGQMGAEPAEVARAIASIPEYEARFRQVFGTGPTQETIVAALAAYVRTLRAGDSSWDRYEKGDKTAVSEDAKKGYALFTGKAQCSLCHVPPLYTDMQFHNVGVGYEKPDPDPGRGKVTNDPKDQGAFKTPGLRNITKSAPYFHDGSVATLEEAVRFMAAGGRKNPNLDPKLKPVKLTPEEVAQILAFLKSLESSEPLVKPPLPVSAE